MEDKNFRVFYRYDNREYQHDFSTTAVPEDLLFSAWHAIHKIHPDVLQDDIIHIDPIEVW
jgi:hypothetical protein